METKICTKCKIEKSISEFYKRNVDKSYRRQCKKCINAINEEYLNNHREERKKFNIKYDHTEKRQKYKKQWRRKKLEEDGIFKISCIVRRLLYRCFKVKNYTKKSKTNEIIGCSFEEFKMYIESKFESWMTWENRGLYNGKLNYGWDLDHIIPISTAKTIEDVIKLNHYTNLQPMDSHINRNIKKDK